MSDVSEKEGEIYAMRALEKSYKGSVAYPKAVVDIDSMSSEEAAFFKSLLSVLAGNVNLADVAVEQRFADYRTVVYGDWDNDFLRYHFGDDGYWVSVRMYPEIIADYEFSPLFEAQTNKHQLHWKASVGPDEIARISDPIIRSCLAFFGCKEAAKKVPREPANKKLLMQVGILVQNNSALALLLGENYELLDGRDVILAGSNYYPSSGRLINGCGITCEHKVSPYDPDAVAVYDLDHELVGYLPKDSPSKKTALEAISEGVAVKGVVINDGTDGGTRRKRKKIHIALLK